MTIIPNTSYNHHREKKGFVHSFLTDPTHERGGRSKRMFQVTKEGREALQEHKKVRDELWDGLSTFAFEK